MPGLWRRSSLILAIALVVAATGQWVLAAGDGWTDLAGPLRGIAARAEAGAVTTAAAAATPGVPVVRGQLQVEVRFMPGRASAGAVAAAGGEVLHVVGDRADILIPAAQLRVLAARPEVAQVAPCPRLIPLFGYGAFVSEGVQLTNASAFQANNIFGTGCRVAVIDTDFAKGLTDVEIPKSLTDPNPPSFRADGTFGVGDHGTACAEIVADMAPGATIHLFAVDTPESQVTALNYAATNHYQVVSMSMGLVDGPFDGSSIVSKAVANARNAGVLVVVAAGNFAQRHWEGDFKDANHNGYCEFSSGVESIDITSTVAKTFTASLSWYETAGATTDQDYDLELFDSNNTRIASSATSQTGSQPPSETIVAAIGVGTYHLRIHEISADGNAHFQLFVPGDDIPITLQVPAHSISVPADALKALSVGATRGSTIDTVPFGVADIAVDKLEVFSSRGPNVAGVLKPDILGPDVVTTSIAKDALGGVFQPYIGTSAAAPHVAGAAALLYSEDTGRTANDLAAALTNLAYNYWKLPILNSTTPPKGMTSGQDDNYGWGRVTLRVATGFDNTPPTITWVFPQPGQTVLTRTPTFMATITDSGSGVNASSIVMTLDGNPVTGFTFDSTTGALSRVSPVTLSTGVHSVALTASDNAGNVRGPITATFQVVPPNIPAGLQLVTLPYRNLLSTDPNVIFTPPGTGAIHIARWVPTDSTSNKYHYYPDPWASFTPPDATGSNPIVSGPPAGLGYFINTPGSGTTLLTVQGDVVTDDQYTIMLHRGTVFPTGWNMIGNPYTSAVQWGTVEFTTGGVRQDLTEAIAAGVTPGIIYELKNTGTSTYYDFPSDPLSATMQPFKGYWVYVAQDTQLVIYSPGISGASAKPKTASTKPWLAPGTWRLRLVTAAGADTDPTLFIGEGPGCTAGYDAGRDVPKPPAVVGTLQSYVPETNWGDNNGAYAQDLHAPGSSQSWDFDVMCTTPNTQVTVTWPDLNSVVPKDVKLILEDPATGRTVYMRTAAAYTFDSGSGGVRALRVRTLDDAGQVLQLAGVRAQGASSRGAVVTFSVTRACQADVDIRNISGIRVRKLATVNADPGAPVSLAWNGVSESGAKVPPGQYLVCVTARSDDGQVVQGIRALQIGR